MTAKIPKPHTVRLRVTDAELKYLREEAEREDRSVAWLLRKALREYHEKRAG